MRTAALLACAALLTVSAHSFAAPGKPSDGKPAPTFLRGVPLPKWAEPLPAIPSSAQVAPVVIRLAETQAWTGPKPAHLVSRAIQVHDKAHLGEIGQYKLTYSPAYEKLSLHRVAILRGDQVIDQTARVGIRVIEREPSLENGFYDGQATVSLLLEDVRVDDTLSITYSIEGRNPVFGNVWAGEFMWDNITPVELRRLVIAHPVGQPLQWRELGDARPASLQPAIERSGTIERIRFQGKALPAVEHEASVPSEFLPLHMIQASEYRSWHEVAVWAAGLFTHGSNSKEVAALARQFEHLKTGEERASAAVHWVQDEIRYFSVALGENSHRPQPPEVVLKRRYGDCKDKSNLLIALLERLGIQAEPVLVNSAARTLPQRLLPSPTWFDHVIVRVHADGKTWFVDPTRESEKGALSTLPVAVAGAAGLVASVTSDALVTIPEDTDTRPQLERHERFVISDLAGDVVLESITRYRGYFARFARQRFRSLSASERNNELLADYEKLFRGVMLVGEPVFHDSADGTGFDVEAKFSLPKPVRHEDGWYLIDHSAKVMDGSLGIPDKLVRKYPFGLPMGKYRASYRLQIDWPEQIKLLVADGASTVDNPFFRAHKEYSGRGNRLLFALDYEVKRKWIEGAELPELQAQSKLIEPFIESSLKVHEAASVKPEAIRLSTREADLASTLATIFEISRQIQKEKNPRKIELGMVCKAMADFFQLEDLSPSIRTMGQSMLKQFRELKTENPEDEACLMVAAFQSGEFREALDRVPRAGIKDKDEGTLNIAWMRLIQGDRTGAAADVQRFLSAQLKDGTLTPAYAASAVALLKRTGAELPRELVNYIAAGPDDVWPRPLLAYQTGRLTQEQLFRVVENLPPAARELALSEAWFYVGQRALSDSKKELALQAFRWLRLNAIRNAVTYVLARAELKQIEQGDPDYIDGMAAADAKQYAAALDRFTKAAARGVAAAQYQLGMLYELGRGVRKDEAKAFDWYRQAADLGDLDAMNDLAVLYDEGRGVAEDKKTSRQLYERAAAFGHYHASRNLGRRYLYGYGGVSRDPARALPYLHDAAELGNPEAQSMLAEMYANGDGTEKDYIRALLWSSLAAEQGDIEAMSTQAFLFAYGHGVKEDIPHAINLYQAAAKGGSVSAQTQLGNAYLNGRGVEKNAREAFSWFSKAMEGGNVYATRRVGEAYLYGDGAPADFEKARAILRKAEQDDSPFGCRALGLAYRKDHAGAASWRRALDIIRQGAEQGDSACQLQLAFVFQFGAGVAADATEAATWYRKGAERGESTALNNLADLYEHGKGVPEDIGEAVVLYRKAAKKGNATSMLSLGELYESGKGVPADAHIACVYYQLAERLGEYRADAEIKRITKTVGSEAMSRAKAIAAEWDESKPLPGMLQ